MGGSLVHMFMFGAFGYGFEFFMSKEVWLLRGQCLVMGDSNEMDFLLSSMY